MKAMKRTSRKRFLVVSMLFFIIGVNSFLVANAWAKSQRENFDFDVFYLGEVIVAAESMKDEGPVSISEVTAGDIERYNATNLGEAMKLLPGVHFRQGRSKEGHYVTVRGFEQENVLILLDGIPIGVPYEGLVNLADIPVQNIAKIKVIKGNASTLYGANAMGGVINIITKKGTADPSMSVVYEVCDYDTHYASLTHGWKKGRFNYFIGASQRKSDGYKLAETFQLPSNVIASMAASPAKPPTIPNVPPDPDSGKRDNSDYDKNSLTFTGNIELSDTNDLGLSFEYYHNEYGVPTVPIYREHKSGFFYFPRYWRFADWERYTLNIIEESRISDTLRLKTRLYYDDYENTLDTYDDNTYSTQNRQGPPSGTSIYDDYSFGLNFQTFWNGLSHNSLALGFSMKKDVHEENFQNSPFDKFVSYTYCVALEDTILLQENLTLTLGGSYDIFDKHERSQVGLLSNDPGNDIKTFSPQVGLSYDPTDAFNIYGSFGRKVRFPTMRNLYATGVIGPQGDPNLKEERTHNYELGCSWLITNQVRLDAALFYSDIENLIHFDNLIGRFEQYEDASIAGVELNMTGQVMDELTASIGYTFLRAENDSLVTIQNNFHNDLVYKPDELPYRPEHKVDFDLCRNFDFGMKINLNGSYISKQRYYDHADPNNNQILTATKKWLDDYVLLNIKIAQAITENIQVFITAENVLDEEYESIHLFPGKGSAFWIGAKIGL